MKKLILLFLLISSLVKGQNLDSTYIRGIVAAVKDGDSYKIRFSNDTVWCRLNFIDCPEVKNPTNCFTAQEMGVEIGDSVRNELKGKEVYVKFMGIDVYNRPLVKVWYNDQDYATNLVKRGYAWVVNSKQLSKEEYTILMNYKKIAVKQRIGLFKNPKAISPALFRSRNKCQ